jgi:hypothetical protein
MNDEGTRWDVAQLFRPAMRKIWGSATEFSPPRHARLYHRHYHHLHPLASVQGASIHWPTGGHCHAIPICTILAHVRRSHRGRGHLGPD